MRSTFAARAARDSAESGPRATAEVAAPSRFTFSTESKSRTTLPSGTGGVLPGLATTLEATAYAADARAHDRRASASAPASASYGAMSALAEAEQASEIMLMRSPSGESPYSSERARRAASPSMSPADQTGTSRADDPGWVSEMSK